MNTQTTPALPDTMSGLIRVALADLRKCEAASDLYKVNMATWHNPNDGYVDEDGDETCETSFREWRAYEVLQENNLEDSWPGDKPLEVWEENRCQVCLAGSVMAQTLGADTGETLAPTDFDDHTRNKLWALDSLRTNSLVSAQASLEDSTSDDVEATPLGERLARIEEQVGAVAYYDEGDPDEFHEDMERLASVLEAEGL